MEEELRTSWGKDLWEIFERGTKEEKMKTLLGSRQIIDGGKLERKNRDAAVKKFLEKIDEIRIGKNLPDLRGSGGFYKPAEVARRSAKLGKRTRK